MTSIPEEKQTVIDGLINYSLRPYAEANGIPLKELILQLYQYHNNVLIEKYKKGQMEDSDDDETENTIIESAPKKRGRPPGIKNKNKQKESTTTDTVIIKRPRGRPKKNHK